MGIGYKILASCPSACSLFSLLPSPRPIPPRPCNKLSMSQSHDMFLWEKEQLQGVCKLTDAVKRAHLLG